MPRAPDARKTFEWMLREGEGESLEQIAEAERVAPTVVRQRVSRLRRFFREKRVREIAAFVVALALFVGSGTFMWLLGRSGAPIAREASVASTAPGQRTPATSAPPVTPSPPSSASAARALAPSSAPAHAPAPSASASTAPSTSPPSSPERVPPLRPESSRSLSIDTADPWGSPGFNRNAAAIALARIDLKPCALTHRTTPATGHAIVTFLPDGAVDGVVVDTGSIAGTAEGACVAARFGKARIPPFRSEQGSVKVGKSFVVPAPAPAPEPPAKPGARRIGDPSSDPY
jgi:hypothetical protein